ncbi:hypothetical protein [Alkaliphilus sp. B6464]|uniref:hypothetical protein n=1 Tax=Alkaliphilus sp. B6464 TaxID=2731219 RepID=UPI001BA9D971|nr:hypothetical protein [Alkaliphilus sp. B6464]QUH21834.1 hypothetical protein HYG84_18020 [Alkaliphilus sp. B6464]
MEDLKCVCPNCGGQLEIWTEYIAYKYEKVLENGEIVSTKSKPKITDKSDNWGYKCSKCEKEWSCTKWAYGGETFPEEVEKIFNKISIQNE